MTETEINPNCTGFCGSPGHYPVHEDQLNAMKKVLVNHLIPYVEHLSEPRQQLRMKVLYDNGFSYAAIADLFGRSHEEVNGIAGRGFPEAAGA